MTIFLSDANESDPENDSESDYGPKLSYFKREIDSLVIIVMMSTAN